MKKRILALVMTLILVVGLTACPAALAEGRYTSSTSLADASSANIININRAVSAINGIHVEAGGRFSFNETVGPRTKAQGFVAAENARGISVTGGGVSQVATTLYLALLQLGAKVEFTELSTYGQRFEETYVDDGNLAVITDYSSGTDFAFKSRTGDMTIEMWTSSAALNCVITVNDGGSGSGTAGTTPPPLRTVSASIPCGGSKGTLKNVKLAAKAVNGTRLFTGEKFSFNDVVGARTKARGYGSGINGRGVKVTGGGVAQVASVIWLAVKQMDDVSVIEKSTYGSRYNQSYVESSADAIVTDYSSGKDFSFRYNGVGSIYITTTVSGDTLRCDIAYEQGPGGIGGPAPAK